MACRTTWTQAALRQRAAILLVSHLMTLLGLVACTARSAAPVAVSLPPRSADAVQVAVVANTSGQGVWLRREPAGEPLKLWPDGALLAVIGTGRSVDGRDWRNVRAVDGLVGWVAADTIVRADAAAVLDAVVLRAPAALTLATPPPAAPQPAGALPAPPPATPAPRIAASELRTPAPTP